MRFLPIALTLLPALLSFPAQLYSSAAQSSFTLDQVMSAPFVSELTAAPAGARVAWIADDQGRRNIWVAQLGSHQNLQSSAQQITHYTEDDGQEISGLAWSADGEWLAYTRGGDAEWPERPAPNPALLTAGVKQEMWLVSANGGTPRDIGEGHAGAISPRGDIIAYLLHGQIWTASLKDTALKPQQLVQARGEEQDLRWSPDGSALAFVSARDDHSFVGVYRFATKTLEYLAPGTYSDGDPAWSPDSKEVAFVRRPLVSEYASRWLREAEPWSICVAEAQSGDGREVWRAERGAGSIFHETGGVSELWWSAGRKIVFPWERGGWTHLYAVPWQGGEATLLTPGEFEVDHVAFSVDRKRIVYSSNQHGSDPLDEDRKHLWSVTVDGSSPQAPDGGAPQELTHGDGIETEPAIASDGDVAMVRMDARVPARAAVLEASGPRDLAPQTIPADFPAAKLVVPQQVIFSAADGMRIHGQLFLPNDGKGKHPAVVFFHGGSRRQMLLGWNPMGYYSNAYAMNQCLASRGYVVLSINYRSGIGYGLGFRQALHFGPGGATEYNDVIGAGLYLRSRADVDGKRIGAWGGSYGGYLTALALARASDLFAAGVDLHGVHDWSLEVELWKPTSDFSEDRKAESRVAWESSPMASLDTWRSPVLLIQGDDDRNVLFAQTVRLANTLRARGVPVEEHVFPDEIHDFLLHRDWLTAYRLGVDFFDRKLGEQH
ncbi:MAG TPA: prolyl oligopeptidase family serine peptidase [Acidobacteriaceae bacterium]|nr:prolyl oligopeptidase family serine peptidase [Acidobacteriaceae bacterium]